MFAGDVIDANAEIYAVVTAAETAAAADDATASDVKSAAEGAHSGTHLWPFGTPLEQSMKTPRMPTQILFLQ